MSTEHLPLRHSVCQQCLLIYAGCGTLSNVWQADFCRGNQCLEALEVTLVVRAAAVVLAGKEL